MRRRDFLIAGGICAGGGLWAAANLPAHRIDTAFQTAQTAFGHSSGLPDPVKIDFLQQDAEPWAEKLIAAAEGQIGVTVLYDPAYVSLAFPNGDLPRERGVCTDVVVRAYRDALGFDLQQAVNKDMKAHFSAYPKIWGLSRPDRNIDHRRVPNLQTYFKRRGADLPVSANPADYLPGDIVTQMLPGNLPHMAIVTRRLSPDGSRPMMVHNIGAGTRLEDRLFEFELTGHYRFKPPIAA